MGWGLGYDDNWNRDVGYGVPAYCDHPGCNAEIDRGLSYVCGGEPYGGDEGCGLFFCGDHMTGLDTLQRCECCAQGKPPFKPSPDHPQWVQHQITDSTWASWRAQNPELVAKMRASLNSIAPPEKPA
jgi:hypothetical protein